MSAADIKVAVAPVAAAAADSKDVKANDEKKAVEKSIGKINPATQNILTKQLKARSSHEALIHKGLIKEVADSKDAKAGATGIEERGVRLAALLSKARRPSKQRLQQLGVIREGDGEGKSPAFAEMKIKLEDSRKRDKLANFLASRPQMEALPENIKIRKADLSAKKESLAGFLTKRPAAKTLIDQKIISDIGDVSALRVSNDTQATPTLVEDIQDKKIELCSAGWGHSALVDDKGKLYMFGTTQNGRLGIPPTMLPSTSSSFSNSFSSSAASSSSSSSSSADAKDGKDAKQTLKPVIPDNYTSPHHLTLLNNVIFIEVGDHHSSAITTGTSSSSSSSSDNKVEQKKVNNKLYAWGQGSWGRLAQATNDDAWTPQQVNLPETENPVAVSSGTYHTLVLTETGAVWGYGWNKSGRLGQGAGAPQVINVPQPIKGFASGDPVVSVSAGAQCSLALTASGKLYSWGCGAFGILGHGDEKDVFVPTLIKAFEGLVVTRFFAGASHCLAVTQDGRLWSWGQNTAPYLPLGRVSIPTPPGAEVKDSKAPQSALVPGVVDFDAKGVTYLSVGKVHNALIKNGKLYTWGKGQSGPLGHGNEQNVLAPTLVQALDKETVVTVECGWLHTIVLTAEGRVYTFGSREHGKLGY